MVAFIIIANILIFAIFIPLTIKQSKKDKSDGLIYSESVVYIGGFKNREGGKKSCLKVYNDRLEIYLENQKFVPFEKEKVLSKNDILDCEIVSKEMLEKQISLGTWAVFGLIPALLFKENKVKVQNFIKLDYKDGEEKRTLIFSKEDGKVEFLVNKVLKLKAI